MVSQRGRSLALVLLLVLVGLAFTGASSALVDADVQASVFAPNNSTVQHENPDTIDQRGDLSALQRALARRLARQLGDSSIQLSQRQYELARRLVDEEMQSRFGKYVDVAGETENEDHVDEFRRARQNQREFVHSVRSYEETYEEYQEARENGNNQRARRLARELERYHRGVRTNGSQVVTNYRNVSAASGVDLSEAINVTNETVANISERQEEVRETLFTETELTVTAESETISFTDPLVLEGRLVTENGTAVANREITITVAGRAHTVTTDDDGEFTLEYRPTTLPLDTSALTVRYRPQPDSVYLGSRDTVDVSVVQVTPDVDVTVEPRVVAFDDRVSISGRVAADDVGASGVPLVLTVDGERIGTTTTGPNGSYRVVTTLPATVREGDRDVTVQVAQRGRALAPANESQSMDVETTPSTITVHARQQSDGSDSVVVTGRVTAADRGVPGTLVHLQIDGRNVGTVRTNESGWYRTTVDAPAVNATAQTQVTREVTARHTGAETNLAPSNASTTVTLAFPPGGPSGRQDGVLDNIQEALAENPFVVAAVLLLLLAALGVLMVRRYMAGESEASPEVAEPVSAPVSEPGPSAASSSPSVMDHARSLLAFGDADSAVKLGYAAVRNRLDAGASTHSHWEFYRACVENGFSDQQVIALREVTEGYEQAAFAPESVSSETAGSVLDAATAALGETDTAGGRT